MSLYEKWNKLLEDQEGEQEFWKEFLLKEKKTYEVLLGDIKEEEKGTVSELGQRYNLTPVEVIGFIDGINTSLKKEVELSTLDEASNVELKIDFEKLYYNMLDARAEWLYKLKEWDKILTVEKRKEIKKEFDKTRIAVSNKVGRNKLCPCGSGKKYKKCCGR
ncbi:MAG: SEC-C domain-containing protein [Clostridiales bacterium]|nr:SEC-C domain-containing protein [Clostridiales bacterium]